MFTQSVNPNFNLSPNFINRVNLQYSEHAEAEEDGGFIQKTGTSCQNGTSLEVVNVPEASSAEFEIASSASGESYKHIGPSISVVEVLKELCQCFLELGTDSTDDTQGEQVNVAPGFDFLKTSNVRNVLGANVDPLQDNFSFPLGSTNGSAKSHDSTEFVSQVTRLFPSNGSDALQLCKSSDLEKNKEKNNLQGSETPNSRCLVAVEQRRCPDDKIPLHDVNDIAKGEEKSKISLVFLTPEGKGWGLRTLEELPKGAFVCEYVGEILTNTELYERNTRCTGDKAHHYPVLLDADWGSEGVLKDEEALCLDATFYGNVARFINHR
ncbi:hypothetical protein ACLOJK_011251 [Asimina triloba]